MGDVSRKERQRSFAGGEYHEALWGRDDLDWYAHGLRRSFNGFPLPYGPWVNRPGSRLCAETYQSELAVVRPFNFSDDDTLVLVFTAGRVSLLRNGAPVPVTPTPTEWSRHASYVLGDRVYYAGAAYELLDATWGAGSLPPPHWPASWDAVAMPAADWIPTSYTAEQLSGLRFTQVGDVVTITHPSHPPYELKRQSASPLAFTLSPVNFTKPSPLFGNSSAHLPRLTYESMWAHTDPLPAREWVWLVTIVYEDLLTGAVYETVPFRITESYDTGGVIRALPPRIVLYPDKAVDVRCGVAGAVPGAASATYAWVRTFRVYRGQGELFGLVGEVAPTAAADATFRDAGDEPNYAVQPPQGRNPFYFPAKGSTIPARTEHPAAVAFHEGRRVFARTKERRGWLWFSKTGQYSNFDRYVPAQSDDPFEPELAANRLEEIRALVPGEPLVALTGASEWALWGSGSDEALSPVSFRGRPLTEHGCSWTAPLRIGGLIVYVQAKGNVVRGLEVSPQGYDDEDFSLRARHLFKGRKVVELAYAEDPWGLVWAILDDGTLLSFTYSKKYSAWGWAKHDVGGAVESICTVPEGDEDVLYLAVRRGAKRYVERLATRNPSSAAEGIFLDCSKTYRDVSLDHGGDRVTITGLEHLEGQTVVALADGAVCRLDADGAELVVAGGAIVLPDPDGEGFAVVHVGLGYESELQTLDSPTEKGRQKIVSRAWIEVEGSRGGAIGSSFETLQEWPSRRVSDDYGPPGLRTEVYEVPLKGAWGKAGAVAVRQSDPLPLTVVSITREVEFGG